MGEPISDERMAQIREWVTERPWKCDAFSLELLPEVDRLRAAIANVNEVHVCIAPSAGPMCDYDGEAWPCTTVRAMGDDARFSWDEQ